MLMLGVCPRLRSRVVAGSIAVVMGAFPAVAEVTVKTWDVPMGGNAYVTRESGDSGRPGGRGPEGWGDVDTVQSVFFRVDRPVELEVALRAKVPQGESRIRATVNGETFVKELKGTEAADVALGRVAVEEAETVPPITRPGFTCRRKRSGS